MRLRRSRRITDGTVFHSAMMVVPINISSIDSTSVVLIVCLIISISSSRTFRPFVSALSISSENNSTLVKKTRPFLKTTLFLLAVPRFRSILRLNAALSPTQRSKNRERARLDGLWTDRKCIRGCGEERVRFYFMPFAFLPIVEIMTMIP